MPRSPDDPVQRCGCGRAEVLCEINSAARDAGLLTPINAQGGDPHSTVAAGTGQAAQDHEAGR